MSEIRISHRIDAHLIDKTLSEVKQLDKPLFMNAVDRVKSMTVGRLKVKEYPTSQAGTANFRFLLSELKLKENFVPDIIYVDYLNICVSSSFKQGKADLYSYIKAISEELRGLAVEMNVPIVSATQFNRIGHVSTDPGMEDVAESFGTNATGDLILGIVRTDELDKLKQIKVIQLKNRDSDVGKMRSFVIGIDIEKMKLYNVADTRLSPFKKKVAAASDDIGVFFSDEMKENMKFDRSIFETST